MKLCAVHSFRRGTGKTTIAANVATLLAVDSLRVALVDINFGAPALHLFFGLTGGELRFTLNDYLWGNCDIEDSAYDISRRLRVGTDLAGSLYLVPASPRYTEVRRMLRGGYFIELIGDSFQELSEKLDLDVLMVDTPTGLNEETLFAISRADVLTVVLRPDQQDYLGTGVILEVAERLDLPRSLVVLNEVPDLLDRGTMRERTEDSLQHAVTAVLPHADEMLGLASSALFALHYPEHPITLSLKDLAAEIARS
ncbi:MAG: MinD/ParA family protein [Candidatus Promineifilaceae bacterium]|nr:MinD/ParA family protein [Candidatus Promineifilaceae bacterium]